MRRTFEPRPYDGWALRVAMEFEAACPGFLATSFNGSSLKRQAYFAAFAATRTEGPAAIASRLRAAAQAACQQGANPRFEIAYALVSLRARQIVQAIYGSVPDGYLGALARLGHTPISPDPDIYRLTWTLFAEPHHRQRAKLLMETEGTITASRIRVVSYLDCILLRRAVLDRLATPDEVASLQEAVRLIKTMVPEADNTRLGQSLDALGPGVGNHWSRMQGLAVWTLGWLEGMQKAPVAGPFPEDDPDLRLLAGKALLEAGRRFRNCLPDHLGHVAAGRRLYYEWTNGPGAIVELQCLSDGQGRTFYAAGEIKGVANSRLCPDDLNAIRARLYGAGVLFKGARTGQRAPLFGLLNVFEDQDAGDAYAGFLDGLEDAGDGQPMGAA